MFIPTTVNVAWPGRSGRPRQLNSTTQQTRHDLGRAEEDPPGSPSTFRRALMLPQNYGFKRHRLVDQKENGSDANSRAAADGQRYGLKF